MAEHYGDHALPVLARVLGRSVRSIERRLLERFPPVLESDPADPGWTDARLAKLRRALGVASYDVLSRVLRLREAEVERQVGRLRQLRDEHPAGPWTSEEVCEFKARYSGRDDEALSLIFGRPVWRIERLARELHLSKDKVFVRRVRGEGATRMPRWTDADVQTLRDNYPRLPGVALARLMGRSLRSINSKAGQLQLRKSPECLSEMGRTNIRMKKRNR